METFLKTHWDQKSPLLLGYSGGPDSKALLHLLLERGAQPLHVAHVDHGWREESANEAELLRKEIERLGLPFHTTRLKPPLKNREDAARRGRLQFFRSLFDQIPFQALLLAHQGDDLAETALKRLLEGAHLPHLYGMEKVSAIEGMPVWRPLLEKRKKELLAYLVSKEIPFLTDATNFDPTYLRSRMRLETLPFLSRSFGKNCEDNLIWLSRRSLELDRYLEKRVSAYCVVQGPEGITLYLKGAERIEARYLIQKTLGIETPSRPLLEKLLDWIEEGRPYGRLTPCLTVRRGAVFYEKKLQKRGLAV